MSKIVLDPNTWHVRWFFWSLDNICLVFFGDSKTSDYVRANGTNRCTYLRTLLVNVPLILILHVLFYGLQVATWIWAPYHFFGWKGPVALVVLIALGFLGYKWLNKEPSVRTYCPPKQPSLIALAWGHVKERFCPVISFESAPTQESEMP